MTSFQDSSHDVQEQILQRAAQLAAAGFGLDPSSPIKLLNYRENAVYRVDDTKTGKPYALRLHRAGYQTRKSIESELKMSDILLAQGVESPRAIEAPNGDLVITVAHPDLDADRFSTLLSWMDGEILNEGEDVETLTATWLKLGALNAEVHKAFDSSELPDGFSRQVWDEDGLFGAKCIWGDYHDCARLEAGQIATLEKAETKARKMLSQMSKEKPTFGLIHADLMPSNVMIDGDRLKVIDFDDSGFGWRLYELATSLFMQELEEYRPKLEEAWIKGYRKIIDIPEADLAIIPTLIMARRLKIFGWMSSRSEAPIVQELGDILVNTGVEIAVRYLDNKL